MKVLLIDQQVPHLGQGQPSCHGFLADNLNVPTYLLAMRLPIRSRGYESGHRCQTPRRVRRQLQVNQCGLNPPVAQPTTSHPRALDRVLRKRCNGPNRGGSRSRSAPWAPRLHAAPGWSWLLHGQQSLNGSRSQVEDRAGIRGDFHRPAVISSGRANPAARQTRERGPVTES